MIPPLPTKWWLAGGAAALALAILTLAYCSGKDAGRDAEVVKQQAGTFETQQQIGRANDNAAEFRVEDVRTLDRQAQELKDATRDAKDADDARAKRGCLILRQQGRDTSGIAACR